MKGLVIVIALLVTGSVNGKPLEVAGDSTIKVLVLPPYDEIANAGVSPDTQAMLETALTIHGQLSVIRFPFKTLMGVPYQMVFDKKYCEAILAKVDCDIIIMTRIVTNNERKAGSWPWTYHVRVYNVRTKKQLDSIKGENLKAEDLAGDISGKVDQLVKEIQVTFEK
jgi:hypothetical protein